jgi:lysophospholipase L1-like esterase
MAGLTAQGVQLFPVGVALEGGVSLPGGVSLIGGGNSLPPSIFPLHARAVAEGDSITAGSSGPTYLQFAIIRTQGRYFLPSGYNLAVGGQTAAQMAEPAQISAVLALNPKLVYYLSGTNDLSGTADTPAQIFANQRTSVAAYLAAGAKVVFICTLPRNDATWLGLTQARRDDRVTLVNLQRAQTDVSVVDLESAFDPTTMTLDGLHPNYLGAITVGNAAGDAANLRIVSDSVLTGYNGAGNFLVGASENPLLSGTAGSKGTGVTGDVADLWTAETNDAGITVVASKTTLNGRTAQRLVISGTNSTNGRIVNFRNIVTYPGVAGEFWEVWWDFALASGAENLRSIAATTDTAAMPNASSSQLIPASQAISGVLRPPMTNALAGADVSVTIQGLLTFAAGVVAADITWAAPFYRKVPGGQ